MCYDDNAQPPFPAPAGGESSAYGKDIVLTSADGTRFAAFEAQPSIPKGAQILIFPDVRGLHGFYKKLALRFAEVGIAAVALDYFGRTAGLTARDDSFEFLPHVRQIQLQSFFADVAAALNYLHTDAGATQPTFTVGFCMGGSLTLLTGTQDLALTGIIPFYAGLNRVMPWSNSTVLEQAHKVKYPVLGLFGGADPGIPVSDVQALDQTLDKAGVEHEVVVYEGAPHSFFDRKAVDFAEASADAWKRILGFIEVHTASKS